MVVFRSTISTSFKNPALFPLFMSTESILILFVKGTALGYGLSTSDDKMMRGYEMR
jgi:hypothetical protein